MIADEKLVAPKPIKQRRLAMYFLPAATVVCLIAAVIYRIEMYYWPADNSDRVFEWVILGICIALLLLLIFIGSWLLVRTQISEKTMRAHLARNEARLKALFQTIPDLIWLKNEQGVYLACNPAFERFFGETESEIAGKTDYDFVDTDLADSFRANDLAALAAGKARANEEWITLADDGKRVLLETIKAPVRTEAGDLIGVMGIARDITRRYEVEREASLFRNLVEFSGDPIYVMDRSDFRMVFVNQAACNHFGASWDEIAKLTVFDWDPDITKESINASTPILKSGGNIHFETRHRTASGKIVPVEITVNKLSLSDGRDLVAGYIQNISERKLAEESLQNYQAKLRQLVAYQDRIREDERKRIAREIHDELGQHLLAMRIDVSMLPQIGGKHPAIDARVDEILMNIDSTIKSVRAIINNLRPSVLDLGIFAALDWQAKEFQRRTGIACELVGNEDELHLEDGLATALFRVMQEAMSNVLRHAQATHVRIELQRMNDKLIMMVADNGIGITSEIKRNKEAFGLVGIMERIGMLGGEAKIESKSGTLLTVSLPIRISSPFNVP